MPPWTAIRVPVVVDLYDSRSLRCRSNWTISRSAYQSRHIIIRLLRTLFTRLVRPLFILFHSVRVKQYPVLVGCLSCLLYSDGYSSIVFRPVQAQHPRHVRVQITVYGNRRFLWALTSVPPSVHDATWAVINRTYILDVQPPSFTCTHCRRDRSHDIVLTMG